MSDTQPKWIDHTFDVVVVGAGGSGLRATLGAAQEGLGLRNQSIPNALAHCCRTRRHCGQSWQYG